MNDDKKMYDVIIDVKQGDPNARPDPHATSSLKIQVKAEDEAEIKTMGGSSPSLDGSAGFFDVDN